MFFFVNYLFPFPPRNFSPPTNKRPPFSLEITSLWRLFSFCLKERRKCFSEGGALERRENINVRLQKGTWLIHWFRSGDPTKNSTGTMNLVCQCCLGGGLKLVIQNTYLRYRIFHPVCSRWNRFHLDFMAMSTHVWSWRRWIVSAVKTSFERKHFAAVGSCCCCRATRLECDISLFVKVSPHSSWGEGRPVRTVRHNKLSHRSTVNMVLLFGLYLQCCYFPSVLLAAFQTSGNDHKCQVSSGWPTVDTPAASHEAGHY